MSFEIIGEITYIETFAVGSAIREIKRLRKLYGKGRWRKRKGIARVRLPDGEVYLAEILVRGDRYWQERVQDKTFAMKKSSAIKQVVVCVKNTGYAVSLERRKIYVALADPAAAKHGLIRIIDESGEDYLYPKKLFLPIALPQAARRALLKAA